MNKTCHILIFHITILALLALVACNPEAKWTEDKVDITMDIETISAGFIECSFSTTKDAYYLVSIQPTTNEYNPMERQKQFMTLALDSAHLQYINWREWLLKEGEFNIAPESSHVLQYGAIDHFFTNPKQNIGSTPSSSTLKHSNQLDGYTSSPSKPPPPAPLMSISNTA